MIGIEFSGGKDSLAVLYLMREHLPEATVYFGDTGIVYPHVIAFVHETCDRLGANLKVVRPPVAIADFQRDFGLPSDIVPVECSPEMQPYLKTPVGVRIQSPLSCCGAMLWEPLEAAIRADGVTTVVRGSKKADGHVGVPDGFTDATGVTYSSPIWDWSDDQVFAYLKEVGATLPPHYEEVNNSFDCYACTAFLTHSAARQRLEWTRRNYPKLWPEIEMKMRTLRHVTELERQKVLSTMSVIDGEAA